MSGKRALLLGGTGAMGPHVAGILAEAGCEVTVTSRRERVSNDPHVSYLHGNARDQEFLKKLLAQGWDVVVDFMKWGSEEFRNAMPALLGSCGQYMFLSSYRVYADATVLSEGSARLLDSVDDSDYLATDEYALAKARCEDALASSGSGNWTVVRPAITYDGSAARLQLGPMEANVWLWRALQGIPVPFPDEMLERHTTMTWAGDVAKMMCRLIGQKDALGETYNVCTSEHASWAEVVKAYRAILPFEVMGCGLEEYVRAMGNVYQIRYDRMYDRVVDNGKVLSITKMGQSDLTPLLRGLSSQLRVCLNSSRLALPDVRVNARLDAICGGVPSLRKIVRGLSPISVLRYAKHRALS